MKKTICRVLPTLLLVFATPFAVCAAVLVVEEDRDPNDGWYLPASAVEIQTRDPDGFVNNSTPVNASTALAQTFTINSGFLLTHIEFAYRTTGPGVYNLALYEVSNPTSATMGVVNTLFSGLTFSIAGDSTDFTVSGSTITYSMLALQLSDAHSVALASGAYYAIELSRVSGSSLSLIRNGQNNYLDGSAYANGARTALGGQDRDFTMSLSSFVIPEPSSVMLLFVGAAMAFRRRLRSARPPHGRLCLPE